MTVAPIVVVVLGNSTLSMLVAASSHLSRLRLIVDTIMASFPSSLHCAMEVFFGVRWVGKCRDMHCLNFYEITSLVGAWATWMAVWFGSEPSTLPR